MRVAIIRYPAGNVRSVELALRRAGAEVEITDQAERLRAAEKVIFPGVGEAGTAMRHLHAHGLVETIRNLSQPVLGICLGMQLLCVHSEESDTQGIGIFTTPVRRFTAERKVPQVGWNSLHALKGPLFREVAEGAHVYFVHGFCAMPCAQSVASARYGESYAAALQQDNFFGAQFHPERSGPVGAAILNNFLAL
jgi:imidazole glycerol-phosphate synthase subunit HisH